jgi:hypothetical protein
VAKKLGARVAALGSKRGIDLALRLGVDSDLSKPLLISA